MYKSVIYTRYRKKKQYYMNFFHIKARLKQMISATKVNAGEIVAFCLYFLIIIGNVWIVEGLITVEGILSLIFVIKSKKKFDMGGISL